MRRKYYIFPVFVLCMVLLFASTTSVYACTCTGYTFDNIKADMRLVTFEELKELAPDFFKSRDYYTRYEDVTGFHIASDFNGITYGDTSFLSILSASDPSKVTFYRYQAFDFEILFSVNPSAGKYYYSPAYDAIYFTSNSSPTAYITDTEYMIVNRGNHFDFSAREIQDSSGYTPSGLPAQFFGASSVYCKLSDGTSSYYASSMNDSVPEEPDPVDPDPDKPDPDKPDPDKPDPDKPDPDKPDPDKPDPDKPDPDKPDPDKPDPGEVSDIYKMMNTYIAFSVSILTRIAENPIMSFILACPLICICIYVLRQVKNALRD